MSELFSRPEPIPRHHHSIARPAQYAWPRGTPLLELAIDGAWIAYFFFGSAAAYTIGRFEAPVWLLLDLVVVGTAVLRPNEVLARMRRHAIFLSWGVFAIISSLWSLNPVISAYFGAQLVFTVLAGVLLLAYMRLEHLMRLLFVTLLISALFSLYFTYASPEQALGWQGAWQGAYAHKNLFGMAMVTLLITGASLFVCGWRPILCLGGMALAAYLLVRSQSGTSMISAAVTMSLFVLAFSYRLGMIATAVAIGAVVVGLAAGGLTLEALHIDLSEEVLASLNKDDTLSGRTLIWELGAQAIESRPWFGHGYAAYWWSDESSANYLRYILQQNLGSFHNTYLEVSVAFGIFGPLLLVAGLGVGFFRVVRAYLLDPVVVRLWSIIMFVHILILSFSEVPIFTNHSLYQVLLVAVVASADEKDVLG